MTHPIIEWTFTPTGASNPDGSLPASFTGTQPAVRSENSRSCFRIIEIPSKDVFATNPYLAAIAE